MKINSCIVKSPLYTFSQTKITRVKVKKKNRISAPDSLSNSNPNLLPCPAAHSKHQHVF